ncbi:hypothetical protein DFQ30_003328 [Apophysomyces sp. BC1015]|nr:hypothetical protein DFQ30_003328 [Apophysomyces sp. BC1015]
MITPVPHGLDPTLSLRKQTIDSLHVDAFLKGLPIKESSSLMALARAYLSEHGHHQEDAKKKILQAIRQTFSFLAKKKKHHVPLSTFCTNLDQYLKQDTIKAKFITIYNKERRKLERLALEGTAREFEANNVLRQRIKATNKHQHHHQDSGSSIDAVPSSSSTLDHSNLAKHAINNQSLALHDVYRTGKRLDASTRKMMSSGLSCTLDLIDLSDNALFKEHEWQQLKAFMMSKCWRVTPPLPATVDTLYKTLVGLVCKLGIDDPHEYLVRMKKARSWVSQCHILALCGTTLNILENHADILDPSEAKHFSEGGYMYKMWSLLLESLFVKFQVKLKG